MLFGCYDQCGRTGSNYYCKPTIIHDDFISQFTWYELDRGDYFSQPSNIYTCIFFITTIVYGKYWSLAKNICGNKALTNLAKNFSQTNKSWFTVCLSVLTALPLLASYLLSTLSESLACWWIQSVPQYTDSRLANLLHWVFTHLWAAMSWKSMEKRFSSTRYIYYYVFTISLNSNDKFELDIVFYLIF